MHIFSLQLKGCNHGTGWVCCEGLLKERKWLALYYLPWNQFPNWHSGSGASEISELPCSAVSFPCKDVLFHSLFQPRLKINLLWGISVYVRRRKVVHLWNTALWKAVQRHASLLKSEQTKSASCEKSELKSTYFSGNCRNRSTSAFLCDF